MGGGVSSESRRAGNHAVSLKDVVEHDIEKGSSKATGNQRGSTEKLLPTPLAHDHQTAKTPDQIEAMRERSGAGVHNLNEVVEHDLLPTPSTSNRDGNHTRGGGRSDELLLPGAAECDIELLPSPTVAAAEGGQKSRSGDRQGEVLLGGAAEGVELLPTPAASLAGGGQVSKDGTATRENGTKRQRSLADGVKHEVELLPTPVVSDRDEARNSTLVDRDRNGAHSGDTLLDAMTQLGEADPLPDPNMLPTPRAGVNRNSRNALTGKHHERYGRSAAAARSGAGLEQALELAQGILPIEFDSWDEVPESLLPTPAASQFNDSEDAEQWQERHNRHAQKTEGATRSGLPLSVAVQEPAAEGMQEDATADGEVVRWGKYRAGILRAQAVSGRLAPSPTKADGKGGKRRLAARFVEWMMLLSDGWVTDVPGLSRRDALKALGNGVVPAQAEAATLILLGRVSERLAARRAQRGRP